jgi:hypothetical protein
MVRVERMDDIGGRLGDDAAALLFEEGGGLWLQWRQVDDPWRALLLLACR